MIRQVTNYFAYQFHLDPQDLHQDIQLKLLEKGDRYVKTQGASYKTWVSRLVYNHCVDLTRKKSNQMKMVDIQDHHFPPISSMSFETRQEIALFFYRVRARWPRHRALYTRIMWLLMTGWKYEDIAVEVGRPVGTVKAVIHRIRNL